MLIVNIKELVGIEERSRLLKRGKEMAETGRIKKYSYYSHIAVVLRIVVASRFARLGDAR